jgi:general secretion pathway protein G
VILACAWTPEAPLTHIRNQMEGSIQTALDAFKIDNGRFPTTAEGLDALLLRPATIQNWRGPYADEKDITDLWKHRFVYRCPGIHNTNGFDLYTCGLDGVSKTDGSDPDDINNWDPSSPHAGDYLYHPGPSLRTMIVVGFGLVALIYFVTRNKCRTADVESNNDAA